MSISGFDPDPDIGQHFMLRREGPYQSHSLSG
jgi:hypothetical protein